MSRRSGCVCDLRIGEGGDVGVAMGEGMGGEDVAGQEVGRWIVYAKDCRW